MAAKVLFFGEDTRQSIPTLERAGYAVDASGSLLQLDLTVLDDPEVSAVAVAGTWEPFFHPLISIARDRRRIPFLRFAGIDESPSRSLFDLVAPANRPASQWLFELDLLVRACRATCVEARRVAMTSNVLSEQTKISVEQARLAREHAQSERKSSQQVRERTQQEHERSIHEIARDAMGLAGRWDLQGIPGLTEFQESRPRALAPCADRDSLTWLITLTIADLTSILFRKVKVSLDGEVSGPQMNELRLQEDSLIAKLETLLEQWKVHRTAHPC